MYARRDPVNPGQESVWDYPRPPRIEVTPRLLEVVFAGRRIAATRSGIRVLETSHPPTYYLPLRDVEAGVLVPAAGQTLCEWKGAASYLDVAVEGRIGRRAAWTYAGDPRLAGYVAFYAALMDQCRVDGGVARPQEGGFYGGWITPELAGPFKGGPGTHGW